MQRSPIEWLKIPGYDPQSWNVTRGCKEVTTGCANCYAKKFAERFRGVVGHPYEFGFDFRIAPFKLEEPIRIEQRCAVFVNSMTDLFYGGDAKDEGENPTDLIRDTCRVMLWADWHLYIILTKRDERMRELLNGDDKVFRAAAEAPHIMFGVSAENRDKGIPRIKSLQNARVRTRCISFEPLLEDLGQIDLHGIHWGKVGGESGAGARDVEKLWVQNIMRQLRDQRIPRHFKQWGGRRKKQTGRLLNGRTYDEYPAIVRELEGRQARPLRERREYIDALREEVRRKWMHHPLLANVPEKQRLIYLSEEPGEEPTKPGRLPLEVLD